MFRQIKSEQQAKGIYSVALQSLPVFAKNTFVLCKLFPVLIFFFNIT